MLITGLLGTVGFSILFFLHPKRLPVAAAGGLLCCFVYLVMKRVTGNEFVANLVGALAAELYAQAAARICKCPSTVFTFPSVIPLIPGGMLYRTMSAIVNQEYAQAGEFGMTTLTVVAGIAAGISIGSIIVSLISASVSRRKNKKAGNKA